MSATINKDKMIKKLANNTFSSLKIRNYRMFYIGQAISTSGTWMQGIAQAWLVLKLTNSGTQLGLVTALQFLPILLFGAYGGLVADRFSKRKILLITQSLFAILAILLGILVFTSLIKIWMVYVFALLFGIVNAIDNPVRRSFVIEMVGKRNIRNAVTLYTSLVNLTRIIGPAIAGILIATTGLALCFILNGISYLAVIVMLFMMNTSELRISKPVKYKKGQIKKQIIQGIQYAISKPLIFSTLIIISIIGTLTYEFQVSLPLIAQKTFNGDARTFAALTASIGMGAVIGGLITASWKKRSDYSFSYAALFFGTAVILASIMPNLTLIMISLVIVGIFSSYFVSLGNHILQSESNSNMRGRVMSFWSMALVGSTAIGGPIIGIVGEYAGPRWCLMLGGIAAIIAGIIGILVLKSFEKI